MHDRTYYDEDTMLKVWKALEESGLNKLEALRVISFLIKNGILFREKGREPQFIITYDPPRLRAPRWAWGRRPG